MADHRHLDVRDVDGVVIVRFVDNRILDATSIEELGEELFALVEQENCKKLLINFTDVEFLSSAALNKLIILDKKVKSSEGKLILCDLRPEINEVFVITRLDQLFTIKETEESALTGF